MIPIPNKTLQTLIRQLPIIFRNVPNETICKNTRLANALRLTGNELRKLQACSITQNKQRHGNESINDI